MPEIIFENLSKTYPNGVRAVTDFSLTVREGEFIVLVGPSGCGKSTLLRMIAGLEPITSGKLMIGGTCVNGLLPKDRDISMVFQSYALYPHMTVEENMSLGLRMRKVNKAVIRQRVHDAAELLDISDLLSRKPGQLSGGQQQRVALGRAMVREPSVFLLDEPLSNLDAALRGQMRIELISLHKKLKANFIYVTHDQTEAMTMGDRIVVMDKGRIQQIGTPEELYRHPSSLFVAGFIGTPKINLIPCVVEQDGDVSYACFQDIRIALPRKAADVTGPATLAVRPEDVLLEPCDGLPSMQAVVELTEMTGGDSYLHLAVGAAGSLKITAKCSSRLHFDEGEGAAVTFNPEGLLLYGRVE